MRDRLKRKKFRREYKPVFRLSKTAVVVSLVGIVFAMGLLYLSQANSMAASGYDIAKLERQTEELKAQNQQLQVEASKLQSIENVEAGVKNSGMVPISQIDYVPASTSVATALK